MNRRQVIVVGGGVIGAACAYYLNKADWAVTIVDKGEFGKGCSHANCGFVCPSHVLPLAEPGAQWKAFKSLFKKNSPLKVKLRFDPALWMWMLRFARRCNTAHMLESGRACQALLDSSRKLYEELVATEKLDCEWETRGLLFVFRDAHEMEEYAAIDKLMDQEFHLPARRYNGEDVTKLEPALVSGLAGGFHYEHDAHLRPDRLMSSLRRLLQDRGVVIRDQCEVQGFAEQDGRATGIVTTQGPMQAEKIIVAAGALTPKLGKHLGCKLPIQPGKGYSITMPRPAKCPTVPLIFPETRVAVTPMQTGYRLGSTMEFAGYDSSINPKRLELLIEGAKPFLHEPTCEPVQEQWCGWRPMTYDGKPIIDWSPRMANVLIAAGHNMLGLSMATGTGRLVAEMVSGTTPHIDPKPYNVQRF